MKDKEEREDTNPPKNEMDELELIREAMKNEADAWKKLLTNLEKITSKKESEK
ncbi:MAG: hypothetical protein WED33_03630 [Bacteroidia bacterium]